MTVSEKEASLSSFSQTPRLRQYVGWYGAAWLLLIAAYWVAFSLTTRGGMSVPSGLLAAASTSLAPMLAAIAVFYVSRRTPLPEERPLTFAAIHVALAVAFTAAWTGWQSYLMRLNPRSALAMGAARHSVLVWQAIIAVFFYGLIAGLAHAIRQSRRARELAVAAERAERLRVQAELASLRAHLNPHFLFNALHGVIALVRADAQLAETALEHLGHMFGYVLELDRQHLELVSLEQEWEFTKSYIWLEQMRMESRLVVEAELEDEALGCAIPPFTLQPLVENAVRHGLAPKRSGGRVRVAAREHAGTMELFVGDDGVGRDLRSQAESAGLGLRATSQRLRGIFGPTARVHVDTAPGMGFKVTLFFPAEAAPVDARIPSRAV